MKRDRLRRGLSILLAAVMLTTGSAWDFSGIVNAEEPDMELEFEEEGTTVSENELPDIEEGAEDAFSGAKAPDDEQLLIPDEDSSTGVYYNAGSASGMTDFRDETIYFVMTTRFYDGDSSNNVQCWDGKDQNAADDPPWRGDFKGLIEKLDYIKALGFTAVWITPVVKNASGYDYHGYHAINFKEVDPRYESNDCTYEDLIQAVHDRGMKIIQDVVFQHTGNWGEENLYPMFTKSETNLDTTDCMQRNMSMAWDPSYDTFMPEHERGTKQLRDRLKLMNADSDAGTKYDMEDIYHHEGFVGSSFEQPIVQYGHIHYADCMDLNTENPKVYHYLVDAYGDYIRMGVDAFRVDTVKHISRLTLNKAFNQQLNDIYNETHGTTGEGNFFMFGEVCTRWSGVWNDSKPSISTPFYTWKETKEYSWDDSETAAANTTNNASAKQHYKDNQDNVNEQPTSDNAKLRGNEYHTPDHSQHSGMNVIDFPVHWSFKEAGGAFGTATGNDQFYNDATYNVVYVDSHDYAPDHAPEDVRYNGSTEQWAENLCLMFTFRGIPCIYYGSEIEFKKGEPIDKGPSIALEDSGRAYFGKHIEGSVNTTDFARYNGATGEMAESLNYPLSLHIQRLNRLRACVPALRKGQYSTEGCNGGMSFKRRYTDETTDSFALVAITENATFTGIPNGTYYDVITGGSPINVSNGTLTTSGIKGKGDLRVYVLDTGNGTPFKDVIDGKSPFMSGGTDSVAAISPVPKEQGGDETVPATSITLDRNAATLDLGETVKLNATVGPSSATNKRVSWSTSDNTVAKVSGGTVTAVNEGTATITAMTSNKLTATATITVSASGKKVESVAVMPKTKTLNAGETVQLTASVYPADADPKYAALTWKSSNAGVADVSASGLVTAKKQGKATITVSTAYFGKSETVEITVRGPKFTYINGDAIYFEKPSGWGSTIRAYIWNKDESWKNDEWPGVVMEVLNSEAGIYGIKWPEGKKASELNIIFTDKVGDDGNQTGDLTEVVVNGYYDQNGYVKTVDPNEDDPDEQIDINSFTVNPAGSSMKGGSVSLTASAEGGTGALQYKFTAQPENGSESTIQDYQASATAAWVPKTAGRYTLKVYVKDSANASAEGTITNYEVRDNVAGDVVVSSFTANPSSGNVYKGSSVSLTAAATGGTGALQYKFTAQPRGGSESTIRDYGTSAAAAWTPQAAGSYTLKVYVKDSGNKSATRTIGNYQVKDNAAGDIVISSFTANPSSGNVYKGSSVSLTAAAAGGTGTLQYKFTAQPQGGSESTIREYGASGAAAWTPQAAGSYTLKVYVKDSGSKSAERVIAGYEVKEQVLVDIQISFANPGERFVYDGTEKKPAVIVKDGTKTLTEGRDYTLTYYKYINAGSRDAEEPPRVVVNGKGDYATEIVGRELTYTIEKAEIPKEAPTASMQVAASKVGDVFLAGDWEWEESDKDKPITGGASVSATAVYNGADRDNYETLTVKVELTGIECDHNGTGRVTETEKNPTCNENGLTVEICQKCKTKIPGSGKVLEKLGHIGGTATCVSQKICARCGASYGELDITNHRNTTIQNQRKATCQQEGYTGNLKCDDCGTEITTGKTIPKTSHAWDGGKVTKEPTAAQEGIRTYTCTACGETKTEAIPKQGIITTPDDGPKAGEMVTDGASNGKYKVTRSDSTGKTVEFISTAGAAKTVSIPNTIVVKGAAYQVTSVAANAFKNNKTIQTVTMGSNVKTIGKNAFYGCSSLKKATLSKNLTSIGSNAFYKCTKLTSITIPAKVSKIGSKAFYNCKKLKKITIKTTKLTSKKVGSKAFKGIASKATIKVPKKKLPAYKKLLKAKGVGSKAKIKK